MNKPAALMIYTAFTILLAACNCHSNTNAGTNHRAAENATDNSAVICGANCSAPACDLTKNKLEVSRVMQMYSLWCWAACGEMCMTYMGHPVSQCKQAQDLLAPHFDFNCCPAGASSPVDCNFSNPVMGCNVCSWPNFSLYNFSVDSTLNSPISFCEIQNQIACRNSPVAFSWLFEGRIGGGGHMMVATGFSTVTANDTGQWVYINNPLPACGDPTSDAQVIIAYCEYVSGSYYSHWRDYYDLEYKNPLNSN